MNPIGITSWIWTSPLTTDRFAEIAPHVARLGFDLLEVPIENTSDLDYKKAAAIVKDLGLSTSVCAAMSPIAICCTPMPASARPACRT